MESFKKITGKDIDFKKLKESPEYRRSVDKQMKQALAQADKATSNLFNTAARFEQKMKVASGRNNLFHRINSFMKSFTFNENKVLWDSFYSMFGKGSMSRKDGVRNFLIVNSRGVMYSYLSQTMFTMIASAAGLIDDDDEMEERAMKRAFAQHGQLAVMGNRGGLQNMMAAYVFETLRSEWADINGESYNQYKDALLYAPAQRGSIKQFLGVAGAEGAVMRTIFDTGDLALNLMKELFENGEISEEKLVEFKTLQHGASLLSQTTGLPINRIGKQIQQMMDHEYDVERGKKKPKKKKKKFSF